MGPADLVVIYGKAMRPVGEHYYHFIATAERAVGHCVKRSYISHFTFAAPYYINCVGLLAVEQLRDGSGAVDVGVKRYQIPVSHLLGHRDRD